jgi:hypothetical protein
VDDVGDNVSVYDVIQKAITDFGGFIDSFEEKLQSYGYEPLQFLQAIAIVESRGNDNWIKGRREGGGVGLMQVMNESVLGLQLEGEKNMLHNVWEMRKRVADWAGNKDKICAKNEIYHFTVSESKEPCNRRCHNLEEGTSCQASVKYSEMVSPTLSKSLSLCLEMAESDIDYLLAALHLAPYVNCHEDRKECPASAGATASTLWKCANINESFQETKDYVETVKKVYTCLQKGFGDALCKL